MTLKKIEFVVPVKVGILAFEAEDTKSFPAEEADEYIKLGWAKCCATGEQGDLTPGVQKLVVQSVVPSVNVA